MSRPEWAWLDDKLRKPFEHDQVQRDCDLGNPPQLDDDDWLDYLGHIEG